MTLNPNIPIELKLYFVKEFGESPQIFRSPGRVNIIGEHTDYNQGFVLPFAIEQSIYIALSLREDAEFHIHALDLDKKAIFNVYNVQSDEKWLRYFLSALGILKTKVLLKGANMVIRSNLPSGAGISSSSALTCGFIFGINSIQNLGFSREEIIKLSSLAENGTGVDGGLMDQSAICLAKKENALFIDCLSEEKIHIPLVQHDYQWSLFVSGVKHNLVETEYNDRRKTCNDALKKIQSKFSEVNGFRDLKKLELKSYSKILSPTEHKRIQHVIEENERVQLSKTYLLEGKLDKLGPILSNSHISLRDLYEVSCPEIDFIIEQLEKSKECLGTRIMGGGFGGSVIALCKKGNHSFDVLKNQYFEKYKLEMNVLEISSANGIELIVD